MSAAIRVFQNVPRADQQLIEHFKNVPTGNVCDAMDRFGAMCHEIHAINPALPMCGNALTVRTRPCDNLVIYQALDIAQPGDIMVIQTYEHLSGSTIGDLVVRIAKEKGMAGFVLDGLCRDAAGIREVGLPVFARGTSPGSPFKDGPGEINGPIACGGIAVHPGDILVGDEDGVVVVPLREAQHVADGLPAIRQKEYKILANIKSGKLITDQIHERLKERGVDFVDMP